MVSSRYARRTICLRSNLHRRPVCRKRIGCYEVRKNKCNDATGTHAPWRNRISYSKFETAPRAESEIRQEDLARGFDLRAAELGEQRGEYARKVRDGDIAGTGSVG